MLQANSLDMVKNPRKMSSGAGSVEIHIEPTGKFIPVGSGKYNPSSFVIREGVRLFIKHDFI